MHRVVDTHKGRSAFPRANNCQGQLQTSRSLSVDGSEWSVSLSGHLILPLPILWNEDGFRADVDTVAESEVHDLVENRTPISRSFGP